MQNASSGNFLAASAHERADVARFFLSVAADVWNQKEPSPVRLARIPHLLTALALLTPFLYEDKGFQPDRNNPGYLSLILPDGRTAHVPYYLADAMPSRATLLDIANLSRIVRLTHHSEICVGGSATFLGKLSIISDIDFCEYYTLGLDHIAADVRHKWSHDPASVLPVITKCPTQVYNRPWRLSEIDGTMLPSLRDATLPFLKFDFVCTMGEIGLTPVSNLVLIVNPDAPNRGSAERSFTYQEFVLSESGRTPRQLVDRDNLGKYLNFLWLQVALYSAKDPIKALKRAFSFFTLLGFYNVSGIITKVLTSKEIDLLVYARRAKDLDVLLPLAVDSPLSITSLSAAPLRLAQEMQERTQSDVKPFVEALAAEMLDRMDALYAHYGASREKA